VRNDTKILAAIAAAVLLIVTGIVWFTGSSNPTTPAGYVGYVTKGAVFGKASYEGLQTGPTSYGRTWLADVVNVSITPTTLDENFGAGSEVLSRDQLKLTFAVHTLFTVRPDGVRELVEKFSALNDKGDLTENAFHQFIREPLRTQARQEVESHAAMEVGQRISDINARLTHWAQEYTKGTPFVVMNVVVGNLQYPKEVSDAVALKLSTVQRLEQKQSEVEIARKDAEKRVVEAEGIAKATQIIQQKLTPLYIQHEAIEAQKAMVGSPNHSTIYIPVGNNGVPLVSAVGWQGRDKPEGETKP
jgi:regulator of protease activity HflC (stomatin/prohibitin superfamily)